MTNPVIFATFPPMPSIKDFPARGVVTEISDGHVIFAPSNTNYLMRLEPTKPYTGPTGHIISAMIRAKARKVYTVPSGGGFVSPIFGPPKTIQGRALFADSASVVIRAGVPIVVDLPAKDDAIDLEEGPIGAGSIVNAICMGGATFELIS
jgi:hypothetical protein